MKRLPPTEELRKICQPQDKWVPSRKVSIYVTKLFLHTPLTANQITWLKCGIYILGASFLIATKPLLPLIGVSLIMGASFLDWVDGEVARYRGTAGQRGATLDSLTHALEGTCLFIFFTLGTYQNNSYPWVLIIGGLLTFVWFVHCIPGIPRYMTLIVRPQPTMETEGNKTTYRRTFNALSKFLMRFKSIYHPKIVPRGQNMLSMAEPVVFVAVAVDFIIGRVSPFYAELFSAKYVLLLVYGSAWLLYYILACSKVIIVETRQRFG